MIHTAFANFPGNRILKKAIYQQASCVILDILSMNFSFINPLCAAQSGIEFK